MIMYDGKVEPLDILKQFASASWKMSCSKRQGVSE